MKLHWTKSCIRCNVRTQIKFRKKDNLWNHLKDYFPFVFTSIEPESLEQSILSMLGIRKKDHISHGDLKVLHFKDFTSERRLTGQ